MLGKGVTRLWSISFWSNEHILKWTAWWICKSGNRLRPSELHALRGKNEMSGNHIQVKLSQRMNLFLKTSHHKGCLFQVATALQSSSRGTHLKKQMQESWCHDGHQTSHVQMKHYILSLQRVTARYLLILGLPNMAACRCMWLPKMRKTMSHRATFSGNRVQWLSSENEEERDSSWIIAYFQLYPPICSTNGAKHPH